MDGNRFILQCRDKRLECGHRTLIMGILNATTDSFSDGGKYVTVDAAIQHAVRMVGEGADIIDVGGESTRPGAEKVAVEEELRRVIPVIEALKASVDVPISIDTYKAEVARRALEAGAHMINDVWGAKEDSEMASVAATYGCPIILMHNRKQMNYSDLLSDMKDDLMESIGLAKAAGVQDEQIILDPGIGFAKTMEHNLMLMNRLHEIVRLGYPVLLGTSRKSFIHNTLQLPTDQVVEGTAATVALGIAQGCHIMRVHDVLEMKRAAVITDAILSHGPLLGKDGEAHG